MTREIYLKACKAYKQYHDINKYMNEKGFYSDLYMKIDNDRIIDVYYTCHTINSWIDTANDIVWLSCMPYADSSDDLIHAGHLNFNDIIRKIKQYEKGLKNDK